MSGLSAKLAALNSGKSADQIGREKTAIGRLKAQLKPAACVDFAVLFYGIVMTIGTAFLPSRSRLEPLPGNISRGGELDDAQADHYFNEVDHICKPAKDKGVTVLDTTTEPSTTWPYDLSQMETADKRKMTQILADEAAKEGVRTTDELRDKALMGCDTDAERDEVRRMNKAALKQRVGKMHEKWIGELKETLIADYHLWEGNGVDETFGNLCTRVWNDVTNSEHKKHMKAYAFFRSYIDLITAKVANMTPADGRAAYLDEIEVAARDVRGRPILRVINRCFDHFLTQGQDIKKNQSQCYYPALVVYVAQVINEHLLKDTSAIQVMNVAFSLIFEIGQANDSKGNVGVRAYLASKATKQCNVDGQAVCLWDAVITTLVERHRLIVGADKRCHPGVITPLRCSRIWSMFTSDPSKFGAMYQTSAVNFGKQITAVANAEAEYEMDRAAANFAAGTGMSAAATMSYLSVMRTPYLVSMASVGNEFSIWGIVKAGATETDADISGEAKIESKLVTGRDSVDRDTYKALLKQHYSSCHKIYEDHYAKHFKNGVSLESKTMDPAKDTGVDWDIDDSVLSKLA